MPRVTTIQVSNFQRDRVASPRFVRGESRIFTINFAACVPDGDRISFAEFWCLRPDVTYMTGQAATSTTASLTMSMRNGGVGAVKVQVTTAAGLVFEQLISVIVAYSPWFQGEPTSLPSQPQYLRADASIPAGPTLKLSGDAPNTAVGVPYYFKYTVTGGTTPVIGSYTANLPPGLSFNQFTFEISGTPTTQGTSNFTIVASSADHQQATLPDAITVNAPSIDQVFLADTPLLYWPLTESSGSIAHDLSGNAYDGQVLGATAWTGVGLKMTARAAGVFLNCGSPTGSPMDVGSLMNWAMEAVVTVTSLPPPGAAVMSQDRDSLSGFYNCGLVFDQTGASDIFMRGGYVESATSEALDDPNTLPLNTRTHFVCTRNGNVLSLYRNGVLAIQDTNATVVNRHSDGQGFRVGGTNIPEYYPDSYGWIGTVERVTVYKHTLTAARVLAHAQALGLA